MHILAELGILEHLNELEREAIPRLRPLRARRWDAPLTGVRAAMMTLLRHLHAVGTRRRVASQGKSYL